ncbi:hypothetical protein [Christiangramia sp. SM2212]|uniref:Dolichyl-diphosphooligosaccharide--protein glycosyltransferase subunit KCP2 n=1 Tax=Christiangramia sediminicola TaxID=3073267 RepID=A0ABU1ERX3_9FLAO|nr:hypothetical protein [Christiangramia sp. SM2212]MDR5590903.1 hypothetical protein [Christiangramia sp. SM2212]
MSRDQKLKILQAGLIAFISVTTGFSNLNNHFQIGLSNIVLGLILLGFIMISLKKPGLNLHLVLLAFEVLSLASVAYLYYENGYKYLQYLFALASLGCVIAIILKIRKQRNIRQNNF